MIKLYIQKATRRSVKINRKRYFLSFPKMIFQICYIPIANEFWLSSLRVAFKCSDKYYFPSLPNINSNLDVCFGKTEIFGKTEDELVKKVVDKFWGTRFDKRYRKSWRVYNFSKILSNLDKWQEKALKNPKWKPKSKDMVEYKNF